MEQGEPDAGRAVRYESPRQLARLRCGGVKGERDANKEKSRLGSLEVKTKRTHNRVRLWWSMREAFCC